MWTLLQTLRFTHHISAESAFDLYLLYICLATVVDVCNVASSSIRPWTDDADDKQDQESWDSTSVSERGAGW